MIRSKTLSVLVMIGCLAMPAASAAPPLTPKQSQRRAASALHAGLAAVGIPQLMQAGGTMVIRMSGEVRDHTQTIAPGSPHPPKPVTITAAADLQRNWLDIQATREMLGGTVFDLRFVLKPGGGFSVNRNTNDYASIDAAAVRAWDFLHLTVPALVLKAAMSSPGSLRWLGEEGEGTSKRERLSFSWNDTLYELSLAADTHLPRELEFLAPLPVDGDTSIRFTYRDYTASGGLNSPAHITWQRDEKELMTLHTDKVKTGQTFTQDRFELPPGARQIQPASFGVESLAEGVYLFKGPRAFQGNVLYYDVLIVDLGESVLVVDAPLVSAYTGALLAAIEQTIPGKPVRYLVATHFHYDHTGGARPLMAAGATIVTTKGNQGHFEKLAAVQSTMNPDGLQIDPAGIEFRFVGDKETIEGSARTVEIHRLDSLSHVDEMLVVYLPEEKLLFQADLYSESLGPSTSTVTLMDWLRAKKISVDRIAGVHSPVISLSDLQAVLAE